jgi:hypothetical protein
MPIPLLAEFEDDPGLPPLLPALLCRRSPRGGACPLLTSVLPPFNAAGTSLAGSTEPGSSSSVGGTPGPANRPSACGGGGEMNPREGTAPPVEVRGGLPGCGPWLAVDGWTGSAVSGGYTEAAEAAAACGSTSPSSSRDEAATAEAVKGSEGERAGHWACSCGSGYGAGPCWAWPHGHESCGCWCGCCGGGGGWCSGKLLPTVVS